MTREKKRSSGSSLAADFYEYCRERTPSVILLAVVTLAVWGVWSTHDIMTFDAEGFYLGDGIDGWLKGWIGVGRWGFVLLKRILRVRVINPYFSMAIFLVAFPFSAVVWSFFICRAQGNRKNIKADILIFGLIYLTHPIWIYQYIFRNQIEVFSIALLILAFAMVFFAEWMNTGQILPMIFSFAGVTFVFGCYQGLTLLFGEAVIVYFFLLLPSIGEREKGMRVFWIRLIRGFIFAVAAYALASVFTLISRKITKTGNANKYMTQGIRWGKDSVAECLRDIFVFVKEAVLGNRSIFTPIFAVLILLLILWMIRQVIKHGKTYILMFPIALFMVLFCFILDFMAGTQVIMRTQFLIAFCIAFLADFLFIRIYGAFRERSALLAAVGLGLAICIAVVPAVQQTDRCLYAFTKTMESDEETMKAIYHEALKQGAVPGMPIYIFGAKEHQGTEAENLIRSEGFERFALPYLSLIGSPYETKAVSAMRALGCPVDYPDKEFRDTAKVIAADLPTWPREGSVYVGDGVIIVHYA